MADLTDSAKSARLSLVPKIPDVRIGDTWELRGEEVAVESFETIDDGAFWPWPFVHYKAVASASTGREGAPAFISATRLKRGNGRAWTSVMGRRKAA